MDHSRNNAINDFIHFYQLIDVLIIDDVQFFNKAEKSQDAFFAIFNHLASIRQTTDTDFRQTTERPGRCTGKIVEPFPLGI